MFEGMTAALALTLDSVFAPVLSLNPVFALFLMSTVLTLIVIAGNALVLNRKMIREIKDKMEEIRENITKAQKEGNKDDLSKFLNEFMALNNSYMKSMYKTFIVSIVVLILFFPWLGTKFDSVTLGFPFTAQEVASVTLPVIGYNIKAWMIWYVLVSFTMGWVIRKLLGFD